MLHNGLQMTLGISMLKKSSTSILKCKHMTLAVHILHYIFLLQHKTIISSIPMCNTKCHDVSIKKVTYGDV